MTSITDPLERLAEEILWQARLARFQLAMKTFNPLQPRDDDGRWSGDGISGGGDGAGDGAQGHGEASRAIIEAGNRAFQSAMDAFGELTAAQKLDVGSELFPGRNFRSGAEVGRELERRWALDKRSAAQLTIPAGEAPADPEGAARHLARLPGEIAGAIDRIKNAG